MFASILQFGRPCVSVVRPCHDSEEAIPIDRLRAFATEAALAAPFDTATVMLGNLHAEDEVDDGPRRSSLRVRRCA